MDNIDGKILMLLDSGKTLREIIDEGDFNLKAYIHMNREEINIMINNWRQFNGASTKVVYKRKSKNWRCPSIKEYKSSDYQ